MERSDVLLLVAGATLATVILRRTRSRVLGSVGGLRLPAQVTLSVAAGLLIGLAPQVVPRPIGSWILFIALGLALGVWTAMLLSSSGVMAWMHRIGFLAALIASMWLGRALSGV